MEENLPAAFDAFDELRALAPRERSAALERLSSARPRLARTVEEMLRADADRSEWLLDQPVASVGPETEPDDLPASVGPYRVVRELGRGTFGRVLLAERDEPFRQTVALKLLQPFRGSRRTIERFRREMRVLSEMEDPGVARLLDAGVTKEGTPYFATEFIDGLPIDLYCRERDLPPVRRLMLIAQVCEAVHHAHQRSIVHRDIKPPNVLVADVRGEPHVRVIDFGIAKLLDPTEGEEVTIEGAVVGTPGYMSPEQRAGEAVDARADVYAIGVLLAAVLTDTSPTAAEGPGGPAARLMASCAGPRARDLRHIVARATHADREQRFPSAAHIGEELRRVIEGRPLASRRDSLLHGAWLYCRRSPVMAAGVAVLVGTVAGLGLRVAATNARLETVVQSQSALISETTGVVADQLGVIAGTTESRRRLVDDLLTRATRLEQSGLGGREIRVSIAQLLGAKGDLAYDVGDHEEALRLRRDVVTRADALASEQPFGVERARWQAEAIIKLGDVHKDLDEPERAFELYERARLMQEELLQRAGPEHIGLLDDLCWSWDRINNLRHGRDRASQEYREGVLHRYDLAKRLLQLDPSRALSIYNMVHAQLDLHSIAADSRDHAAAREHAEEALDLARAAVAAEPDRLHFSYVLLVSLRALAGVAEGEGRPDEAVAFGREAIAVAEDLLARDPNRIEVRMRHLDSIAHHVKTARRLQLEPERRHWEAALRSAAAAVPPGLIVPRATAEALRGAGCDDILEQWGHPGAG